MNCGKSSNCVHWLYAVLTGTLTNTDFSTFVAITSSSLHDSHNRQPCRHLIAVVSDPILLPRSGCTKPAHRRWTVIASEMLDESRARPGGTPARQKKSARWRCWLSSCRAG